MLATLEAEPAKVATVTLGDRTFLTERIYYAPGKSVVHRAVSTTLEADGSRYVAALKAVPLHVAEREYGVFGDGPLPRNTIAPRVIWRDEENQQALLESEYCDTTLAAEIDSGRKFTTSEVARIVSQTCLALKDSGTCHRDIKPDNIFLRGGTEAAVADWELAVPIGAADGTIKECCGTPGYMAMEVVGAVKLPKGMENGLISEFSRDAYALGVTAAEAIEGRRFNLRDQWGCSIKFAIDDRVNNREWADHWMRRTIKDMVATERKDRIQDPKDLVLAMSFYESTHDLLNDQDKKEIASHYLQWSERFEAGPELVAIAQTLRSWDIDQGLKKAIERKEEQIRQAYHAEIARPHDQQPTHDKDRREEPLHREATNSRATARTITQDWGDTRPIKLRPGFSQTPSTVDALFERRTTQTRPPPDPSRDR